MTRGTCDRLTAGKHTPERCLEAAFRFLLDREPKESILRRFDVTVIARYFPEFERELPRYQWRSSLLLPLEPDPGACPRSATASTPQGTQSVELPRGANAGFRETNGQPRRLSLDLTQCTSGGGEREKREKNKRRNPPDPAALLAALGIEFG
jgi:hypothetical protein